MLAASSHSTRPKPAGELVLVVQLSAPAGRSVGFRSEVERVTLTDMLTVVNMASIGTALALS